MTDVGIIKAEWSGFSGAPGVSQFAVVLPDPTTLDDAIASLSTAFLSLSTFIPQGVSIAFPGLVEIYEAETGVMQGEETVAAGSTVTGGGTGARIAAGGTSCMWTTGAIQNGRRVRGRTYFVPLSAGAFDTDGTLSANGLYYTQLVGQGVVDYNALAATSRFAVWGRPRAASESSPAKPFSLAPITGFKVSDKMAVLRSRRD